MECVNRLVKKALEQARQLTILADEIDTESDEDGCAVLGGIIRDCAYKIRARAEQDKARRMEQGQWVNTK